MCGGNIGQRGQRRLEVGFLDPILKTYIGTCLGTNSPHVRVHERRPKHEKLKYVNPQQPSHTSPPPFHGNASFQKIHQRPPFCTSPDWLKLVGFLVGRTIHVWLPFHTKHGGFYKGKGAGAAKKHMYTQTL